MLAALTRVHYGLTCLLKDLWTWPWLSLRTTAYFRIQYMLPGCLIILATTSMSLSWGMASYAPVTSACRIHVSTIKHGWVQGQGSCWLCPWCLGSNLPIANLQEIERCRRIPYASPTTLPHIPIPQTSCSRQRTLGRSGLTVLSLSHCPRLSTLRQGKPTLSLKTLKAYKGPWLTQMLKHPGPGGSQAWLLL